MNRDELLHAIRAAADVLGSDAVLVMGSQAILASHPEWELPPEATRSTEVDIGAYGVDRIEDEVVAADLLDGNLGELSRFDESFGFYVDGVTSRTATLTEGWRDRLVAVVQEVAEGRTVVGWCLDKHDLWVAKAVASRPKDVDFCTAVARAQIVNPHELAQRIGRVADPELRAKATALLERAFA